MKKNIIIAGLLLIGSIPLSAYTYEVNPLLGKNYTEQDALINDSTAYGLRLNRFVSEKNAIMFGYTRINDATYKKRKLAALKAARAQGEESCIVELDDGTKVEVNVNVNTDSGELQTTTNAEIISEATGDNCDTDMNSGGSGNNNGSAGNNNGSAGNNNGNAGNNNGSAGNNNGNAGNNNGSAGNNLQPSGKPGVGQALLPALGATDTDIDRFYINGLHNFTLSYKKLVPYVYAGLGYERVSDEILDQESQGFFDAGTGVKYQLTDNLNILADVQGIKKFKNHDLDILGSIGIGFLFGNMFQPAPEAVMSTHLADIHPKERLKHITVIKDRQVDEVNTTTETVAPILIEDDETTVLKAEEFTPVGEYYIQMAAGFDTDMETDCIHTKKLRAAGLDYDIKYSTIDNKNAALVVVGPYQSFRKAAAQLPRLRKYSKGAFVKKITE